MYCMYDTCILGGNLLPYIFTLLSWEAVARKFPHGLHWYAYLNSRYITLNVCILVCIYLSIYVCMYVQVCECMYEDSFKPWSPPHTWSDLWIFGWHPPDSLDSVFDLFRSVSTSLSMYVCMYVCNKYTKNTPLYRIWPLMWYACMHVLDMYVCKCNNCMIVYQNYR